MIISENKMKHAENKMIISENVTDFEDFGSGELGPKPSPSDLKNTLFFRVPILKGKSHTFTFPNRQLMPKIVVFGKI